MSSYYFNLPSFGKYEDYTKNNINIYITEGTYVKNCTLVNTYNDIANLGKIFRVEKKAQSIIISSTRYLLPIQHTVL